MTTLGIFDAPSVFSRAFRAMRPQFTSSDFPVNAIYGFIRILVTLQTEAAPLYLVAVTESDEVTSARMGRGGATPDESLVRQIPHVTRILETLAIPTILVPGHRSSDLVATLARMSAAEKVQANVMACGPEFYQLPAGLITVENPFTRKRADHGDIIARFGIPPARIPDYLALVGDASEGPAGVPGIGPKMARLLLEQFGSMDRVLEHIDQIERPGLRELIRENADMLRLSSRLASFDSTIPLSWSLQDFERTSVRWDGVLQLIREFELTSLLRKIPVPSERPLPRIAETAADVAGFVQSVGKRVFLRVESEGRPFTKNRPLGLALATARENSLYIPVPLNGESGMDLVLSARALLEDEGIQKVGHGLKWDTLGLRRLGIRLRGHAFDTCLADTLLAPKRNAHTLGTVALAHIPGRPPPLSELQGQELPPGYSGQKAAAYLSEAVSIIAELSPVLESKLRESGVENLFRRLDIPMVEVLAGLEDEGLRVSEETLKSVLSRTEEDLEKVTRRAAFMAGEPFELASDKEVREVLFNRLRLPPPRKVAQGYAVDDDVLEDLSGEHELPQEILDYRYLKRLQSWCRTALKISGDTGSVPVTAGGPTLVPDEFNPFGPLPVFALDAWQPALREAFVPVKGHRLVCGHYSNLALRLLAHLSRDDTLLETLGGEGCPIMKLAGHLFETPPHRVSPETYRRASALHSAVVRGIGFADLARHLGVPPAEGRGLLDLYFRKCPTLRSWISETSEQVKREGTATTLFGRRIPLPHAGPGGWREWALSLPHRMAALALQGTVSDMVKTSVQRIHEALRQKGLKSRLGGFSMCGDILVEATASEVEPVLAVVTHEMESALKLSVPVVARSGAGMNWTEARQGAGEVGPKGGS